MNYCSIAINTALYSKEAVIAAEYNYSADYYIEMSEDAECPSTIIVRFEKKDGSEVPETLKQEFLNNLIDQQLRVDMNRQFGHIRDLIVEEAFKPVNK